MSSDGGSGAAAAFTRTTCPYCGVGCGVLARAGADGVVAIEGDPSHPANFGRLCSKGAALGETVSLEGRLLVPEISLGSGQPRARRREASWDEALGLVADRFKAIIAEHGPEAVALYVSGQLLTEDYYVANKLVKGWFGTANIDTNSRLCMSSAVSGHVRAFGEDVVPCSYEDLENTDLLVLVGSNLAWCHPVLYQRVLAARALRPQMRIVVIDPRRTPTCEIADLHLGLRPGSDVALFNGLLAQLHRSGCMDRKFVAAHTEGLESARAAIGDPSIADTAEACGLDAEQVRTFFGWFAATSCVVTAFSMGVNQSSCGADKVNSIINCHLLTGRIGIPGAGPFSITGQPNAMGGREVGGLANMLAAHLALEVPEHREFVREFWNSPRIASRPGLKAVELFEAVGHGRIKAVWIIATNPVVSLPDADAVRRALEACPLVVVSDCVANTDTARLAHVLLPAAAWGEKDGTVTNSERRISRQRPFLPLPGEARPDWWILCEFARHMGWAEGFGFRNAGEIFAEHARLSGFRNGKGSSAQPAIPRRFDLSALSTLTPEEYATLSPTRWPAVDPARLTTGVDWLLPEPARFAPTRAQGPAHAPDSAWPLRLNTGRVRDHWHTMTRTGRAPRLAAHRSAPFVSLHEQDAAAAGISEASLVRIETRWGVAIARAQIGRGEVAPGSIFVPIHWNDAVATRARMGALVNPVVDPVSGEPEFKHTPARISAWPVAWEGLLLIRSEADLAGVDWWTRARGVEHWRYEMAGRSPMADWASAARQIIGSARDLRWLEYRDPARACYRAACLREGRLQAVLWIAPIAEALPAPDWTAARFIDADLDPDDRTALLAGRKAGGADAGPPVCACFGVGLNTILQAIREQGLDSTQQIGRRLKAGTNCGSCLPELRALLTASPPSA